MSDPIVLLYVLGTEMFVRFVLEQILSGEATENVVENIHEYLSTVSENVRAGKIKLDEFIVFKVRPGPS